MTSATQTPGGIADSPQVRRAGGSFNEALGDDGQPRPHWRELLNAIERQGPGEFALRAANGRRLLREHGVTFGSDGDSNTAERLWELDFLPLVIAADEWRDLAAGLTQRARLLNAMLGDLYGVQRVVRNGFVPAPLVYANPGYLRPCQALPTHRGIYLHTYAADLARSPDGRWWVLADRTEVPIGLGFAQEARSVTVRVLPEAIRLARPRTIEESLRLRREALRSMSAVASRNAMTVLLSPGPRSENSFEHACLARLLGFTLVEGGDLTVRDRRVFMKTLEGLRQVEVILRGLNSAFCDPLELRADSLLGVPGLVEAARAGNVAIGNAIGAGLLESPGFLPFLPNLCRQLLDEDLRLPSVATWWCGQPAESKYVRQNLDTLALRSALNLAAPAVTQDPAAIDEEMCSQPHNWVGQERVPLSTAPGSRHGNLLPQHVVLRAFVIFDGESFAAVPGGLARVTTETSLGSIALSLSGLCKDVWVLSGDKQVPERPHCLTPQIQQAAERTDAEMPSRTAENFFWLGRYTEARLEQHVRVARCVVHRLSDESGPGTDARLAAMVRLTATLGFDTTDSGEEAPGAQLERGVWRLMHDDEHSAGIPELLRRIRAGAFSLRDRLSGDTWQLLNRLRTDLGDQSSHLPLIQVNSTLNRLVLHLAALSGMQMENVTRGYGWIFLDLGRRIERGLGLLQLVEALIEHRSDLEFLIEPVLEIADSVMTYRRRCFAQSSLEGVLDLLLGDATNPRSVAFQVVRISEHTRNLPEHLNPEGVADLRRWVTEFNAQLQKICATAIPSQAEGSGLSAGMASVGAGLRQLSETLTPLYFSHVQPRVN